MLSSMALKIRNDREHEKLLVVRHPVLDIIYHSCIILLHCVFQINIILRGYKLFWLYQHLMALHLVNHKPRVSVLLKWDYYGN